MDIITLATTTEFASGKTTAAILPVGSFEQHGPHLPLATDTIVASGIAQAVCDAYGLLLLPPITMSCSHEHAAWPGTVSISSGTLRLIVNDVMASLRKSGIGKLVIANGHGGNYVLANVVQELSVDGADVALFPGRDDWAKARDDAGLRTSSHADMHAGEIETSLLLHLMPDAVRTGYQSADHDGAQPRRHLLTLGMSAYTTTGVIGSPSLGDAGKGKLVLESLTESFDDYLAALGMAADRG